MIRAAVAFVALTACIQVAIAAVEMFCWTDPRVYTRLELGFDDVQARRVAPIVQNAGLYNGFLAAGLIWSLLAGRGGFSLRMFFLSCVVIAGVFGAVTLRPTTLALQSLPASIALALTWWTRSGP